MKRIFSILAVSELLALTTLAQETNTVPTVNTNQATIASALGTIFTQFTSGGTNWYFPVYGTYASQLKEKWGGGFGAFYPLSDYILAGVRMDYIDDELWMPSGNATLQVPLHPFKWLTITPLGYAGIGIPISGATFGDYTVPGSIHNNDGQVTAIYGYGVAVGIYKSKDAKWSLSAFWEHEKWSGFPGSQEHGGLALHVKF